MFAFPDPVALYIGPLAIKWYGLAYVFGSFLAWSYGRFCLGRGYFPSISLAQWDGALNQAMLGMVLGGRLGYFILYSPETFVENPMEILRLWHAGMAFHGGLLGVALSLWWYARRRGINLWSLMDLAAVTAPLGLFLGRLANFVNQEHCGHPTKAPWGIVFPCLPDVPRHPSQLYEAGLEGVLLFFVLRGYMRKKDLGKQGKLSGIFLVGYGVMRLISEFFRLPDGLYHGITLGQCYSIPCIIFGLILFLRPSKV